VIVKVGEYAVTFSDRTRQYLDDGSPVSTLGPKGHAEIFLQACAANGIEAKGPFDDTSTGDDTVGSGVWSLPPGA
jgi:hypothetical protein